jgi:hypothetical protein
MVKMVAERRERHKQLLALQEEKKRREKEIEEKLARLKQEQIAQVKNTLQECLVDYKKVAEDEFGQDLKESAWEVLADIAPDWWKAKEVKAHDTAMLMQSPEERQAEIRRQQEEAARWTETSSDGRYKKSRDGVILDTQTNLEWYVGPDKDTNWDQAKAWVDGLTVDGGGWRFAKVEELQGLYQQGKGSRNMDPIFNVSGCYVWSCERDGSSAFNFDVGNGLVGWRTRGNSRYARVFGVRGGRRG